MLALLFACAPTDSAASFEAAPVDSAPTLDNVVDTGPTEGTLAFHNALDVDLYGLWVIHHGVSSDYVSNSVALRAGDTETFTWDPAVVDADYQDLSGSRCWIQTGIVVRSGETQSFEIDDLPGTVDAASSTCRLP